MNRKFLTCSALLLSILVVGHVSAQEKSAEKPENLAIYRVTPTKVNDLVHTKLDVSFDYAKRYLNGKEWVTLKPHFYPTDSLTLDAQGMDIKTVALVGTKGNTPLKYVYNDNKLFITLNKKYTNAEKYTIYIAYTAKPDELKVKGSAAITDAKGLYFINPDGTDKDKPTQIWTQGETESSSAWFPTIDKPDQKTTQEISMTVKSKYTTLSNGKLVSQKPNADGTRTDTWKMELPHSPYLFMMAIGDFKITKDTYKGKEVNYYLEPKFAPYAKQIFGKTPEMMKFYSETLGLDYPWNKYAQVVARDYVSGAMENTTSTLHGEQIQKTDRELLDGNEEGTIAHELFHQWFGDYVTAESWSNLTMNESFATFGEVIWHGHDAGKDAEDKSRYEKLQSYISSTKNGESPVLARFHYADKEDMFDNVSYAKGSVILYALKNQMGDAAFYKSLNKYLTTNAFKNGETHQLRLAMEEVTGKDWSPYFNQWYYNGGHPILAVDYDYSGEKATIKVKQTQDSAVQTFTLPVKVDIYAGGKKISKEILINSREQTFSFEVSTKPDLIDFDVDKIIVGELNDNKVAENYYFQYKNAPTYANRIEAIQFIMQSKAKSGQQILLAGLKDPSGDLRALSIDGLNLEDAQIRTAALPVLLQLAKTDKDTEVKAAAISKLAETGDQGYKELMVASTKDRSYRVIAAGISGLAKLAPQESLTALATLDQDTKTHIAPSIATLYISDPKDEHEDFYANIATKGNRNEVFAVIGQYFQYLRANTNPTVTEKGLQNINRAIERLKLQAYLNKQLSTAYEATAQGKSTQAKSSNGEAKANLNKQAELFKKAAADLGKE
ncbi:M1 family metallopeptidase [Pedobacter sp. CFBP9032]|uniref:M1 family metallopeptidase n=1 Tax=Pedobacter sp. CFBP9032 TaxID=3096539 RepID=UPI002A6A3F95|nr:M1 family metallopeptidase [Pedobacter sp. CFBP9032]MDY0903915.1 M1 family metallopeptidase [Pedobacter sp. CFBP9032]